MERARSQFYFQFPGLGCVWAQPYLTVKYSLGFWNLALLYCLVWLDLLYVWLSFLYVCLISYMFDRLSYLSICLLICQSGSPICWSGSLKCLAISPICLTGFPITCLSDSYMFGRHLFVGVTLLLCQATSPICLYLICLAISICLAGSPITDCLASSPYHGCFGRPAVSCCQNKLSPFAFLTIVCYPSQDSAKLSVLPCFARVRFCSPVFCPFLPVFCPFLPIFCPKMGRKWAKTGKFGFVCFCLNSPEFARFHSLCACAVCHPLVSIQMFQCG